MSLARLESNRWLVSQCANITGHVLSIGSGRDEDCEGGYYRDYFPLATSYTTSDVQPGCTLVVDVRSMPEIPDGTYDCVFCSTVLEHVDDYQAGLREMTRILKPGGVLLLGLPFGYPLHGAPNDFWRFTEYGIRYLLRGSYEIEALTGVDLTVPSLPAGYWVRARKL